MAELARGRVSDRPWGRTLGTLALRGLTGQLNLYADGRVYSVAFNQGVIFGATSPLPNDAAVRIAMTGGLVSSTQVNDLGRRLAAAVGSDEIDVIAEALRLVPEQTQRLRRRVIAQRAARTFSIENGEFIIDDAFSIGYVPGSELDIRSVVYLGARSNLSDERLDAELASMGGWFQLKPEATGDLPYFGFADGDRTVLQQLSRGATMADLHAAVPEIDGHTQRAIVYSLVACGACDAGTAPRGGDALEPPTVTRTRTDQGSRAPAGPAPAVARTQSATSAPAVARTQSVTSAPAVVRTQSVTSAPAVARTQSASSMPRSHASTGAPMNRPHSPTGSPRPQSTTSPPPEAGLRMRTPTGQPPMHVAAASPQRTAGKPATARAKRSTAETRETEALIKQKLVEARGDHFQVLGVAQSATPDQIRTAYFNLARKLHPDRLSSLGIADDSRDAQRLFAQINTAFAVLNDPKSRDEYIRVLSRGGEAAVRAQDAEAEEMAARVMRAEEAFRRGEMAMRRDQLAQALAAFTEAVELQPKEVEYQAMLAWARFASAPDKNALANETRKALLRATEADDNSPTPRFYLGRVERMLGREREALAHFQAVLAIKPNHAEAASEARVLEQRLRKR